MVSGLLKLKDAEFWSEPFRTRDETQRRLSQDGFLGVALDAPKRVPLDGRQTIPVVGWQVATFRESQRVSFEESAVVVAVSKADGRVYANRLHDPRVRDTSRPRPEPEDPGEGKSYRAFRFDLNERVGVGLREDAFAVTLLVRDQRSNTVDVSLSKPNLIFRDPAVEAFLAAQRADDPEAHERFPDPVFPVAPGPGALPSYERGPKTPPAPKQVGVALAVPAEAPADGPCVVRGSFTLPVPPELHVRPRPSAPDWSVGDPRAKAVVPLALVLTGDRLPGPYVVELRVPLYETPGELASGAFAVELAGLRRLPPQRYSVYAAAAHGVSGPAALELK